MSLKVKLISCISLFMLMIGVLIIGVFAATQQQLTMEGSVSFNVPDKSLYVKDVRIRQDMALEPTSIDSFMPGYINGDFTLDLTGITDTNTYGSFSLYFDIINTTDIQWAITDVYLPETLTSAGVSASYSGVIPTNNLTDTDSDGYKNFDASTPIDGSLILTITAPNSSTINLEGIVITINEYVPPVTVQVTSVSSSGATEDTYNDLTGQYVDSSVDLAGITFNTGETTLTISMTSLNANYIKNKVSWVNTSGVTISSTSLYLPQNPSEQLTSGTSRDLTITVNNTGSATTISGLEVEFEEKTDLLQVTEEDETSTYTEEGYWYVEMGTYSTTSGNAEGKRESEYLRWRYFSDTTSHYEFDRNTRPTGDGYFILESCYDSYGVEPSSEEGGLCMSWNNEYIQSGTIFNRTYKHQLNGWTNIDANDYATSNIRQYINGNTVYKSYTGSGSAGYTPYGTQSNMFADLHIDPDNDIVYSQIIGRTLGDLYSNNLDSASGGSVDFPDLSGADVGYQYQETDTDRFWLLSYYEAYNLLSGNATTSTDLDRYWGEWFLLRSPRSSHANISYCINSGGAFFLLIT